MAMQGRLRALLLWPIGTMIALHASRTESFGYDTRIFIAAPVPTCYGSRIRRSSAAVLAVPTSPRHRRTNHQPEGAVPIALAAAVMAQQQSTILDPQKEEEEEEEEVDSLTTMQTKQLRKEAEKRRAWKILNTISFEKYVVEEEELRYNADLIHDLVRALEADGLVELRGISKNSRRHVYAIAEEIAANVGELRSTVLLTVKGHAAVYFSPATAAAVPPLRTTRKENQWTKRKKAERDNRGQIIIDSEEEMDYY